MGIKMVKEGNMSSW